MGLGKKLKLIMEGPFPAVWRRQADCSVWKTHPGKARRRAWKRRSGRSSAGAPNQQIATMMETKPKAEWFILCAGKTEEDSVSADISSWQLSGHLHKPAHTDLLDGSFLPTHGASGTAAVRPQAQALQGGRGQIMEREAIRTS